MSNIANPELVKTVVLLATSVTIVPLFKHIGLGSVLGYLVAGCLIGPSVFGLFLDPSVIVHMAELGVVMFLFIIGLEMHPERLWSMRKAIFVRGLLQVSTCGALLTLAGIYILGLSKEAAFITGMGFTLSSTAIVMQVLEEHGVSTTANGQRIIATLIFEDLAIVPLLASVTFLAPHAPDLAETTDWTSIGIALTAVAGLVIAGKWLMNPIFRIISKTGIREVMTAAALLVVLGTALAMEFSGLSMAMGAFVAGVMLSESSFRHQLEADIEPFRGLLLGLFFMGVGMSLDLTLLWHNWLWLLSIVLLFVTGKALSVYLIARLTLLHRKESTARTLVMSHGGEFAFVLFSAAAGAKVLTPDMHATFTAAVIISMLLSPLILALARRITMHKHTPDGAPSDLDDDIDLLGNIENSVLVIGFGRFNQIVCQVLLTRGIRVSVIDSNIERIRAAAKFGFKVYYGDGTRLDVLQASGLEKVNGVILGINNIKACLKITDQIKQKYPWIPILARTHDRQTAIELIKHRVDFQIREIFESALELSRAALIKLGVDEIEAEDTITQVRHLDQQWLTEEIMHGLSYELARKYWKPTPFIKPHQEAQALNPETADILAAQDEEQQTK